MSQVSTLAEQSETATPKARVAPRIPSEAMVTQNVGHLWKEWLVRAPQSLVAQDLHDDPLIWKNIQASPVTSLARLDRLTIAAHDQSWFVTAIVVEANETSVVLHCDRVIRARSMGGQWQDDQHAIRWDGQGFGIFRKSDDVRIIPGVHRTLESAKHALFSSSHYVKRSA